MMITPLNLNTVLKYRKVSSMRMQIKLPQYSQDADVVSFKSRENNTVSKDFTKLSAQQLMQIVKNAVKDENMIGWGGSAKVYKIPDTKFCVRVPRSLVERITENQLSGKINIVPLTTLDKINHVVTRLSNGVSVMPIIEGESCFDCSNGSDILSLPQTSFDRLLKQICQAVENDAQMDPSPKNLIYNQKDKSLTAIDFVPFAGFGNEPYENMYNILRTIYIFMDDKDNKISNRLSFIVLNSALKDFEHGSVPVMSMERYNFSKILSKIGITTGVKDIPQFKILKECFSNLVSLKVDELNNKSVEIEQLKNIKLAKALINQLFNDNKDNRIPVLSENFYD